MTEIKEGSAVITVEDGVFFNPKMKKLRDISVMLVASVARGRKCRFLDATSATGVRGIRYALEAGVSDLTFIDINEKAAANTVKNALINGLQASVANISIQEFANTSNEHFDIIDLDPFGSAAPYIYDIMKISRDNTMIMVTATDTAVLCGAHRLACLKTYGAEPIHNELCHEAGLRILISFIAKIASQFNFGIEVMLGIADMHYMRVFLRLHKGAANAIESIKQIGFLGYCNNCHNFYTAKGISSSLERKCSYCGEATGSYGPLWLGSISDKKLLAKVAHDFSGHADMKEALAMLSSILEELDTPFSYSVPKITKFLGISSVSPKKLAKALSGGSKATGTIFCDGCIKTDAKIAAVIDAAKRLANER
ncbi:MAG: tRNA (guanine(10)-N(2))-dimethyltransferase [Candidatus Micrarchaeia archaeon]